MADGVLRPKNDNDLVRWIGGIEQRVAACCDYTESTKLTAEALAIEAAAKATKGAEALAIRAGALVLNCKARQGKILSEVPRAQGARTDKLRTSSDEVPITAEAVGITRPERQRLEALAEMKESGQLDEYTQKCAEAMEPVTVSGALRHKAGVHVSHNSGENEWYTPPEYLEAARAVLGKIDLDPASSRVANERVKATRIYTAEDNGLEKPWKGRVWMNPPYAQPLITDFCERLVSEYEAGNVKAAIALVNNGTETGWGQRLLNACAAVCFPKGRIRFIDPEGKPSGAPLQGQMVVYLGDDKAAFRRAFKTIGVVR